MGAAKVIRVRGGDMNPELYVLEGSMMNGGKTSGLQLWEMSDETGSSTGDNGQGPKGRGRVRGKPF